MKEERKNHKQVFKMFFREKIVSYVEDKISGIKNIHGIKKNYVSKYMIS